MRAPDADTPDYAKKIFSGNGVEKDYDYTRPVAAPIKFVQTWPGCVTALDPTNGWTAVGQSPPTRRSPEPVS